MDWIFLTMPTDERGVVRKGDIVHVVEASAQLRMRKISALIYLRGDDNPMMVSTSYNDLIKALGTHNA